VVALIDLTSKVIMIKNRRAMARAFAARLVVVIKTSFKSLLKFQLYLVVQHLTIKWITHNICLVVMHLMMVSLIPQVAVITTIIGTILVMSPMLIAATLCGSNGSPSRCPEASTTQEIRLPLTEWQSIGHGRRGHSMGAHDYLVD
jgi:hypothetical protein